MKRVFPFLLMLCLATAVQAASSFAQGEEKSVASGTSVSQAFDSNNTAGNYIVYGCGEFEFGSPLVASDTNSNTYNLIKSDFSVVSVTASWWYTNPIAAGANTVKCTIDNTKIADFDAVQIEVSNLSAIDQNPMATKCTSGCSGTFNAPTITTSKTENLFSFVHDKHSNHTWSISTGWTLCAKCQTNNVGGGETAALAYWLNAPAGTYTPTWTNNGAVSNGTVGFTASFGVGGSIRHKSVVF